MARKKSNRGAPKGCEPRNPSGVNGRAGDRADSAFTFRLMAEDDAVIRQHLAETGMSQTDFWRSLAADWLQGRAAKPGRG